MSTKYDTTEEAIHRFIETAVSSNLLDLTKDLFSTFSKRIDISSHPIEMCLYSVIRTDNPDMAEYLFSQGADLQHNQLGQVIEDSPFDVFKVVVLKYLDFFKEQHDKGRSPLKKLIDKNRFKEADYLKTLGFNFSTNILPFCELVTDIRYRAKPEYVAYVLANIDYPKSDYNALDDDSSPNNKLALSNSIGKFADSQVIEAFKGSNLAFVLTEKFTVEAALREGNQALLDHIISENVDIDLGSNIECSASKFVSSPAAFKIAIKHDEKAKARDYYTTTLIRNVIKSGNVETFDIACLHIDLLSELKAGTLDEALTQELIQISYTSTPSKAMLEAFFGILGNNTFSQESMITDLFSRSIEEKAISPVAFLEMIETKGGVLNEAVFYKFAETVINSHLSHYKDGSMNDKFDIFKMANERVGIDFYEKAHTHSDLYNKSAKQMLSIFRKSYFSDNDNSKATQVAFLFACSPESKRIEFLNAMSYADNLRQDIAFTEAMRIWDYDPMSVLTLPISDKIKAKVVEALS